MEIIIVEDDQETTSLIVECVSEIGGRCISFTSGEELMGYSALNTASAVILDIGLPGISGIEVCRKLRALGSVVPICILSSRSQEVDIVLGLEAGADDYLTKPIRRAEFLARIRALLRRAQIEVEKSNAHKLEIGPLVLDEQRVEILYDGTRLDLTKTEYLLLRHLMLSRGGVCTKDQLLENVWGYQSSSYEGTLGVHVSRLRAKLQSNENPLELIQTVWGIGYRLVIPPGE